MGDDDIRGGSCRQTGGSNEFVDAGYLESWHEGGRANNGWGFNGRVTKVTHDDGRIPGGGKYKGDGEQPGSDDFEEKQRGEYLPQYASVFLKKKKNIITYKFIKFSCIFYLCEPRQG